MASTVHESGHLTPGLLRAITRNGTRTVHGCGFAMPKYPGRYPKNCPHCGDPFQNSPAPASAPDPGTPPMSTVGEGNERKLDKALRRKIADALTKAGLDGNGRFDSASLGLSKAWEVLGEFGIEPDEIVDSHKLKAGRATVDLAWHNDSDADSPVPIPNTMLVIAATRLESEKYEVVVYLS
jgi:hypothetical protein